MSQTTIERPKCWTALALAAALLTPPVWATESLPASQDTDSSAALPVGLVVPELDLSAMQPAARRKVEAVQASIERLLGAEPLDSQQLAGSFGLLAQLLHAFEKLDDAAASYESARRLDPNDPQWPYYLGLIHVAQGDFELAIAAFESVLKLAPTDAAAMIRLGNALIEVGRLEAARSYFERVRDAGGETGGAPRPETAAALYGLGRILDLEGDSAEAAALFEQVIEKQPGAGTAHYALGQAYRNLGEVRKARRHLALANEISVGFPDSRVGVLSSIAASSALGVAADLAADERDFSAENFVGFVTSQLGSVPGAVEQLEGAVAELGKSDQASSVQIARLEYAIGVLLVRQDRDEDSIEHFRRAAAGDPELTDARQKLGNALARTGRLAEAFEIFDAAVAAEPENAQLLAKRAAALVNLDRLAEAQEDLERVVEIEPGEPEGWRLLSGLRERQQDAEGAVAAMRRSVELADGAESKMAGYVDLGGLNFRLERYRSAAEAYLEALRIDQEHVPALSRLAALLGQLREFDRAAEVYARWSAVEPQNPVPRLGEATTLLLGGRYGDARDRLEEGLDELPGNLDLSDILARHLAACPDPSIRDGDRALELALEVYDAFPTLESVETLAMAYAEAGEFEDAVRWQKRLIGSAEPETPDEEVDVWRANLARYERGQACCAPPDS